MSKKKLYFFNFFLGLEQVPIPVINGINNEMLDFCNYSIKRVPMEGVHMNLDQEFVCGCDCDDDCIVSLLIFLLFWNELQFISL